MKKIIAKVDFSSNVGSYVVGDEIKDLNYNQIVKLNEKGFIEPLDFKDLVLIKRELDNPNKSDKNKEEEKTWH